MNDVKSLSHSKRGCLHAYNDPEKPAETQYLPDARKGRQYYRPTHRGKEANAAS